MATLAHALATSPSVPHRWTQEEKIKQSEESALLAPGAQTVWRRERASQPERARLHLQQHGKEGGAPDPTPGPATALRPARLGAQDRKKGGDDWEDEMGTAAEVVGHRHRVGRRASGQGQPSGSEPGRVREAARGVAWLVVALLVPCVPHTAH